MGWRFWIGWQGLNLRPADSESCLWGLLKPLMIGQSPSPSALVEQLVSSFSLLLVGSLLPGLLLFLTPA